LRSSSSNQNHIHWTQITYRKKSRFHNPLRQNYGHIKTVQSLFKLPESAFHGVVVFTGGAEFKTEWGAQVIRLNELFGFIQQPWQPVLDERQMAYVVVRIEMKRQRRSLETDEYHLNYVRRRLSRA
jgi:restriction system protein